MFAVKMETMCQNERSERTHSRLFNRLATSIRRVDLGNGNVLNENKKFFMFEHENQLI